MSQQSFFKIIDQMAKTELVSFMEHNKTELTIKILGKYVKTSVLYKKNETHLSLNKFGFYDFSNEKATCSFQVNNEKYLFQSHLTSTTSDYVLEIPENIYQLQRRNNYRVVMPSGQIYLCEILPLAKDKIKAEIRNLSLGGCKLSVAGPLPGLKQDDELFLNLKLDKFEFQKIQLLVRRIRFIDSANTTLIATSFKNPDHVMLSELQTMLVFLDRVHRGKNID